MNTGDPVSGESKIVHFKFIMIMIYYNIFKKPMENGHINVGKILIFSEKKLKMYFKDPLCMTFLSNI